MDFGVAQYETVSVGINSAATSEQGSPPPTSSSHFQAPPLQQQRFRVHSTSSPRKSFSTISVGSRSSSVHGSVHGKRKRRRVSSSTITGIPPPMIAFSDEINSHSGHSQASSRRGSHPGRRQISDSMGDGSITEAGHPLRSTLTHVSSHPHNTSIDNPLGFLDSIDGISERSRVPVNGQLSKLPIPVFIDLYCNVAQKINQRLWAMVIEYIVPSHLLLGSNNKHVNRSQWTMNKTANVSHSSNNSTTSGGIFGINNGGTIMAKLVLIGLLMFWTITMCLSKILPMTVQIGCDVLTLIMILIPLTLTCSTQILSYQVVSFDFMIYFFNCCCYLAMLSSSLTVSSGLFYAWFSFAHLLFANTLWYSIDAWCIASNLRLILASWLPISNIVTFIVIILLWPMKGVQRFVMFIFFMNFVTFQFRNVYSLIFRPDHWICIRAPCSRHWYRSLTSLTLANMTRKKQMYGGKNRYHERNDLKSAGIAAAFRSRNRSKLYPTHDSTNNNHHDYHHHHYRRRSFSDDMLSNNLSEIAQLYPRDSLNHGSDQENMIHHHHPYHHNFDDADYIVSDYLYSPDGNQIQSDTLMNAGDMEDYMHNQEYVTMIPDESNTEMDPSYMIVESSSVDYPSVRHIHQQRLPPPSVLGRPPEKSVSRLTGITEETYQSQMI